MKIGFSTIVYLPYPAEYAVKNLLENGIDTIEILYEVPQITKENKIQKLTRGINCNLSVHAPFYDVNPASLVPSIRSTYIKRVLKCINFASKIGTQTVILHPGHFPSFGPTLKEEAKIKYIETLKTILNYSQNKNISIAIENESRAPAHKSICYPLLEEIKDLIELFDNKIKVCLDIGHAFITSNENIAHIVFLIRSLGREITYIHLHDNDGKNDLHLIPGEGKINFPPIFDALKKYANKSITCIIEVGNKGSIYDGNETELIRKSIFNTKRFLYERA
jgi:sugar phosphate isomerase/epimerase